MNQRPIPAKTREEQTLASDPALSAWVSANAGSGKTHVLTQRVVRLLLDGVPPARILCLTFTKAAAANMSIRVFDKLAEWTRIPDDKLKAQIMDMGAPEPDAGKLVFARRLFARTVETPGGLKIQTIHAFCEKLLHLFPFEANVAARFEVLDDERSKELLEDARRVTLEHALRDRGALGAALVQLADETSGYTFDSLIKAALGKQELVALAAKLDDEEGDGAYARLLAQSLGATGDENLHEIDRAIAQDGIPPSEWAALAAVLDLGGKNDKSFADGLRRALQAEHSARKALTYGRLFTTEDGDPKGLGNTKLVSKDLQKTNPDLLGRLEAERERVFPLLEKRKIAHTVARTRVLLAVIQAIIATYRREKEARGLLDFGDLIVATRKLLKRTAASWVLHKLDRGIDHILVDEAQDTSPEQWDILKTISDEFTSGTGQREVTRTFFAVGDEKQSIFSFQGARPDLFHTTRGEIERKTRAAGQVFQSVELKTSFRSSSAIINFVDQVFALEAHFAGLSAENLKTQHEAWKADLPGLVEIWPQVLPDPAAEPRDWTMPVDALDQSDPAVMVARRIASKIASLTAPGSRDSVEDEKSRGRRPVRPGDIMILVRNRGAFFDAVIRALKEARVPVAGADRLRLTQHIAVMDLIAVGRAALLPDDDLTLAIVLKSPLIGLNDDDLMQLAPKREGSLYEALAASQVGAHQRAYARLQEWRALAKSETPFFFYARLLGAARGRHDMLARLGPEAGDAMDEFLRLALDHDIGETPSLVSFLARMQASDLSIKRDMETGADAVRVMTVHASKGLEAKIVFLGDTVSMPSHNHDPKLLDVKSGGDVSAFAWTPGKKTEPKPLGLSREDTRNSALQEYRRLLYVAMTRAEERLYVTAFGKEEAKEGSWYKMICDALADELARAPAPDEAEPVLLRLERGDVADLSARGVSVAEAGPEALPDWLMLPARHEPMPARPLSPSSALAAADRMEPPRRDPLSKAARAAEAGRLVHALLQYLPDLPVERRAEAGQRYLATRAVGLSAPEQAGLLQAALAVLAAPELAALFGAGSQAEVSVGGRIALPDGQKIAISGQIDRLFVSETEVLIADFKTGVPHTGTSMPAAYLAQLAMYGAAVGPLYPGRTIRAFLIWTEGAQSEEIAPALLEAALLDVARARS